MAFEFPVCMLRALWLAAAAHALDAQEGLEEEDGIREEREGQAAARRTPKE